MTRTASRELGLTQSELAVVKESAQGRREELGVFRVHTFL